VKGKEGCASNSIWTLCMSCGHERRLFQYSAGRADRKTRRGTTTAVCLPLGMNPPDTPQLGEPRKSAPAERSTKMQGGKKTGFCKADQNIKSRRKKKGQKGDYRETEKKKKKKKKKRPGSSRSRIALPRERPAEKVRSAKNGAWLINWIQTVPAVNSSPHWKGEEGCGWIKLWWGGWPLLMNL